LLHPPQPFAQAGCTPYVKSLAERDKFLDTCRRYFDFFLGELGGVGMTPLELARSLRTPRSSSPSALPSRA
jgi:hypothetical protein